MFVPVQGNSFASMHLQSMLHDKTSNRDLYAGGQSSLANWYSLMPANRPRTQPAVPSLHVDTGLLVVAFC